MVIQVPNAFFSKAICYGNKSIWDLREKELCLRKVRGSQQDTLPMPPPPCTSQGPLKFAQHVFIGNAKISLPWPWWVRLQGERERRKGFQQLGLPAELLSRPPLPLRRVHAASARYSTSCRMFYTNPTTWQAPAARDGSLKRIFKSAEGTESRWHTGEGINMHFPQGSCRRVLL